MGMSSSQARLLSITARLTDNEYHSQRLTNEKMKLSNITDNARVEYNLALDAEKLMFTSFDSFGTSSAVQLTPNLLYLYQPIKNQYALVNSSGKILIPKADAQNFKNTKTLFEFLKCYDDAITTQKYTALAENPDYSKYIAALDVWKSQKPNKDDYYESGANSELYNQFSTASSSCFSNAVGGSSECYLHVLAHMLDLTLDASGNPINYPKNYPTSIGTQLSIQVSEISGSAIHGAGQTPNMAGVSNAIKYGYDFNGDGTLDPVYAYDRAENGSEGLISTLQNKGFSQDVIDNVIDILGPDRISGNAPSDAEKLLSSYYLDGSGAVKIKTLEQKCVDLFYAIENNVADYNTILKPMIYSFQDDLVNTFKRFKEDEYNAAIADWESRKPPEVPRFVEVEKDRIIVNDKEKSQWYTNLWYRMQGSKEPQVIDSKLVEEAYDETNLYYTLEDQSKIHQDEDIARNFYSVLDNKLASSSSWIKDVVSQGIVTIENIQKNASSEDKKLSWNSIIYTNAVDISTEDDSSAIASAEAKYQMVLDEVNVKDKRYQSMIRKLDTEHNALQTEYDSVKQAMEKNIDRSYKTFKG